MAHKTTGSDSAGERPRGRPRSAEAEIAILEATRSILEESGSGGVSVSEVVARAGVSTATIYRRWKSVRALVLEAIHCMVPAPVEIDTGSLRGDIALFLDQMSDALLSLRGLYTADLNNRDRVEPEMRRKLVHDFVVPRQKLLAGILARAQARGELRFLPAIEVCWDYMVGPIHHRLLIRGEPFSPESQRQAEQVLVASLRALEVHQAVS